MSDVPDKPVFYIVRGDEKKNVLLIYLRGKSNRFIWDFGNFLSEHTASLCRIWRYFQCNCKVVWCCSLLKCSFNLYMTVFLLPGRCAGNVSRLNCSECLASRVLYLLSFFFYCLSTRAIRKLSSSIMCITVFVSYFCTCLPNCTTLLRLEPQMTYLSFLRWKEYEELQSVLNLITGNRVLLEKPKTPQLVKKFPAFYATRMFIIAFKSARHLSLSWAGSVPIPHLEDSFQYPPIPNLRLP